MNWIEVIITIGSTVGVLELIKFIRDWRLNRRQVKEETKQSVEHTFQSQVETIDNNIELLQKVVNLVSDMADKSKSIEDDRLKTYDEIITKLDRVERDIKLISNYLNGDFAKYKRGAEENKELN